MSICLTKRYAKYIIICKILVIINIGTRKLYKNTKF